MKKARACLVAMSWRFPITGLLLALLLGCTGVRPIAQRGVDLLENTERSYATRVPAGIGFCVGELVALPASILLLPTYAFDLYGPGVREPTEKEGNAAPGDIAEPLVFLPLDYGSNIGANFLGAPFAFVEEQINGPADLDEAWVEEDPEPMPSEDGLNYPDDADPWASDPASRSDDTRYALSY